MMSVKVRRKRSADGDLHRVIRHLDARRAGNPLGVATVLGHLSVLTSWTTDAVWPTQGPDGLKAFSVVDERLNVYHGASIAHWSK